MENSIEKKRKPLRRRVTSPTINAASSAAHDDSQPTKPSLKRRCRPPPTSTETEREEKRLMMYPSVRDNEEEELDAGNDNGEQDVQWMTSPQHDTALLQRSAVGCLPPAEDTKKVQDELQSMYRALSKGSKSNQKPKTPNAPCGRSLMSYYDPSNGGLTRRRSDPLPNTTELPRPAPLSGSSDSQATLSGNDGSGKQTEQAQGGEKGNSDAIHNRRKAALAAQSRRRKQDTGESPPLGGGLLDVAMGESPSPETRAATQPAPIVVEVVEQRSGTCAEIENSVPPYEPERDRDASISAATLTTSSSCTLAVSILPPPSTPLPLASLNNVSSNRLSHTAEKQRPIIQKVMAAQSSSTLVDEFDSLDFDLAMFEQLEAVAIQQRQQPKLAIAPPPLVRESDGPCYRRFLVLECTSGRAPSNGQAELTLTVVEQHVDADLAAPSPADRLNLRLRGDWLVTDARPGDAVHVLFLDGKDGADEACTGCDVIVDNSDNVLLFHHPDLLVSPTRVSDALNCPRMSVLKSRHPCQGGLTHPSALMGTLKHELFERALTAVNESDSQGTNSGARGVPSQQTLAEWIREIVGKSVESLYGAGVSDEAAIEELLEVRSPLIEWLKEYTGAGNGAGGTAAMRGGDGGFSRVLIKGVVDTEEDLWSPTCGMKGCIDATIAASLMEERKGRAVEQGTATAKVVALELKTGRRSAYNESAHRAQTMLYSLMLRCRYGDGALPSSGLLLYLSAEGLHTEVVTCEPRELRHLVLARNRYAIAQADSDRLGTLPAPLRNPGECNKCYSSASCMLVQKALEGGSEEESGTPQLFSASTDHLLPHHLAYFRSWDSMIEAEAKAAERGRRRIWLRTGRVTEEDTGQCLSGLKWAGEAPSLGDNHNHVHRFTRDSPPALTSLGMSIGDMVIISMEGTVGSTGRRKGGCGPHFRLLTGKLSALTAQSAEVTCDSALRVPTPTAAQDIEDIACGLASQQAVSLSRNMKRSNGVSMEDVVFRLDRDQIAAGVTTMRLNVMRLFAGPAPEVEVSDAAGGGAARDAKFQPEQNSGDENRRRLLVDMQAPRFKPFTGLWGGIQEVAVRRSDQELRDKLEVQYRDELNEHQRLAVQKVLTCRDYALLLGMPGTGKTATVCFVVRALLARGASVLITSYTHSAVDTLLLRLLEEGVECLRIGNPAQVHPGVRGCCIQPEQSVSTEAYATVMEGARVVGVSCLGVSHPIFSRRRFDYCVVDEAGQITQPAVLGPLRCADAFVLVGDHYQLPPLVTSQEAKDGGMDVSMFRRLSEAHPHALQRLSYQYRMNEDVMYLCNALVYGSQLRCGTPQVARQQLILPRLSVLPASSWVTDALRPYRRVVFLDTDAIGRDLEHANMSSGNSGGTIVNNAECSIVIRIVQAMETAGGDLSEIGVISPYRSQLKALNLAVSHLPPSTADAIELNTVDKFQGRDKGVVIVSLVRSNAAGKIGDLLRDWRRVNVLLSRAKQKLILIGSSSTLSRGAIGSALVTIVKRRQWIMRLPADALAVSDVPRASSGVKYDSEPDDQIST